jgi:predicted nucleic acid-binding protein
MLLSAFTSIMARSFEVLPLLREHFPVAARFAKRHDLGLRGSDALHLALCEAHGIGICTLNHRMRDAAIALGIGAVIPQ